MIHRQTERLLLRNFTTADLEDMLEITQQYEASEMGQYDQPYPQTAEGLRPILEYLSAGDEFAAVEHKSQGKMIGLIQFQAKTGYGDGVVRGFGYTFNANYQGKGYATEACKEALDYLFGELHIDKCVAGTAKVNVRSRQLLDKLGFIEVGEKVTHFRENEKGEPINFEYILYEFTRDQ